MMEEIEKTPIEKIFDWYNANVLLRLGAVALVAPTHGASALFDVAITSGLAYLRRQRLDQFRSELVTLSFQPSEGEVRSNEFIESFLTTAARVQQTRREEKIKLLTLLFVNFWKAEDHGEEASEVYEEDLAIIDEIGLSELHLLLLLASFEKKYPARKGENKAQQTGRYWHEFQEAASKRFAIEPLELESYLQRISRTGLYQPITGAFMDYAGGRGYLTGQFFRLQEKIEVGAGPLPG